MKNEETLQKQTDVKRQSRKKYIIAVILFLLLITPVIIFLIEAQKPDPVSEKIIREAAAKQINKEPNELTDEDFAKITEFTLSGIEKEDKGVRLIPTNISDIDLLKKFINLQKLYLGFIQLPDKKIPNWMKILGKYGIYNLDERFALDISSLKKLKNLQSLTVESTPIKIKPISSLKNLKVLHLVDSANITSLKFLKGLTNLQELIITSPQISTLDLEPIKGLKNLQTLSIPDCPNITNQQFADLQKTLPNLKIIR